MNQPHNKPQTAAIYSRVSSRTQEDGSSLHTQEQACRELADRLGATVSEAHVYREVYSGAVLWDRPELSRLREAIRRCEIDLLLVHAIDRLTREPVHLGIIISDADRAGVTVQFVTEDLDTTPEGQLLRFVRGYAAKVEHEKIKERSLRGKKGPCAGGQSPQRGKRSVRLST